MMCLAQGHNTVLLGIKPPSKALLPLVKMFGNKNSYSIRVKVWI